MEHKGSHSCGEGEETAAVAGGLRNRKRNRGGEQTRLKKGPWTKEEDRILGEYVRTYGEGHWNVVHRNTGLRRCGKSCRLRWANHLRPDLRKGSFSVEEERMIVSLHAQYGNKWAKMASQFHGRTDNDLKNFWNTRLKRRERFGLPLYPVDPNAEAAAASSFRLRGRRSYSYEQHSNYYHRRSFPAASSHSTVSNSRNQNLNLKSFSNPNRFPAAANIPQLNSQPPIRSDAFSPPPSPIHSQYHLPDNAFPLPQSPCDSQSHGPGNAHVFPLPRSHVSPFLAPRPTSEPLSLASSPVLPSSPNPFPMEFNPTHFEEMSSPLRLPPVCSFSALTTPASYLSIPSSSSIGFVPSIFDTSHFESQGGTPELPSIQPAPTTTPTTPVSLPAHAAVLDGVLETIFPLNGNAGEYGGLGLPAEGGGGLLDDMLFEAKKQKRIEELKKRGEEVMLADDPNSDQSSFLTKSNIALQEEMLSYIEEDLRRELHLPDQEQPSITVINGDAGQEASPASKKQDRSPQSSCVWENMFPLFDERDDELDIFCNGF